MSRFSEQIQDLSPEELQSLLVELHSSGDKGLQDFLDLRVSIKRGEVLGVFEEWLDKFPKQSSPKAVDLQEGIFLLNQLSGSLGNEELFIALMRALVAWVESDSNTLALEKFSTELSQTILQLETNLCPQDLLEIILTDQSNRLSCLSVSFKQLCSEKDFLHLWDLEQKRIEIFKLRQDFAMLAHYSEVFASMALSYENFSLAEEAYKISHSELGEYQRIHLATQAFYTNRYEEALGYLKFSFSKLLVDKLELQEQIYRLEENKEKLKENLLSQFQLQPDLKRYNKIYDSGLIQECELYDITLERSLRDGTIQRSLRVLSELGCSDLIIKKTIETHDDFELIFIDELYSLKAEFETKEKLVSLTCLRAILVNHLKDESYSAQKEAQDLWSDIKGLSKDFESFPSAYLSHQTYRQELHYRFPEHRHLLT